ncbi:hypothetical protein E3N88_06936 [Mikania micrantha]|uniref:Uncharacterized protein n=1 Tax=Mikania micrantha TaxID=192012 RepID=A0A5N6PSI9_9ASTR|nr:hypothetical protein E3N88_06936 [Mikania micrantha]
MGIQRISSSRPFLLPRRPNISFSSSKPYFEAFGSRGSHPGTFLQALIIVLTADIRQISSSAGTDSDPSEATSAASQATPAGPHTPSSPRPVTPPPPPSPTGLLSTESPRVGRITTNAGTGPQDYGATPETSDGSPR